MQGMEYKIPGQKRMDRVRKSDLLFFNLEQIQLCQFID